MKKLLFTILLTTSLLLNGCSKNEEISLVQNNIDKTQIANPSSLITVTELHELLENNEDVIMIGALSNIKALIPGSIESKGINGSYTVWRDDYSGDNSIEAISTDVSGFRNSQLEMEELLSKAGATPTSTIVVYSAGAMHDSARLYFQISLLGHEDVRYLDGGLNAWVDSNIPSGDTNTLVKEEIKTNYFAPNYTPNLWDATVEDILYALENPDEWVVIDTRAVEEYLGEKTSSSTGAYGTGRIKDSIHIAWNDTVDENSNLKSVEELQELYGEITKDKKVITYCQSGVRSSHSQYVLKNILGLDEVYNYDGSWIEWSYINSSASNVSPELKERVSAYTELFNDNQKPI